MLQTVYYEIASGRIPESFHGYKIVLLSDLHGAEFGKENEHLLESIRNADPDIILMAGDMADNTKDAIARALDLCKTLALRYPIYYVTGNHELTLGQEALPMYLRQLRDMGITVLENSWCTISHKGSFVKLYGLHMPLVYYKDPFGEYQRGITFTSQNMKEALGTCDGSFGILLAHNPLYFPAYRDWGADLTLSGHMHGGVIHIPGIGGLFSPDIRFFPKYDAGLFCEKGRQLVISRGLGNHFLRRVWNDPEIVVITLNNC